MLLSGNNIGLSEKYPPPLLLRPVGRLSLLSENVKVVDGGGGGIYLKCCPENFLVCRKIFTVCRKSNAHVPPPPKKNKGPTAPLPGRNIILPK